MAIADKPLPQPTPVSEPFWRAAREHELRVQRCNDCNAYIFYPRSACTECASLALDWVRLSGRGIVYSYTIASVPPHPGFDEIPFVIALIELEEGIRIASNIVECEPAGVQIGMPVEVVFEDITSNMTLIKFKPIA